MAINDKVQETEQHVCYKCKCCGVEIEFDKDDFDLGGYSHPDGEELLWGHLQLDHEDLYDECQNWETPFMIEEYYDEVSRDVVLKNDFEKLMEQAEANQYNCICSAGSWVFEGNGPDSFAISHNKETVAACKNNQIIDAKWGCRVAGVEVYDVLLHLLEHVPQIQLDPMSVRTDESLTRLGYMGPSDRIADIPGLEDIDYYRAWVTTKANEIDPDKKDYVVYWDQGNTWCEVLAVFEGFTHDEFVSGIHAKYNEWLREDAALNSENEGLDQAIPDKTPLADVIKSAKERVSNQDVSPAKGQEPSLGL